MNLQEMTNDLVKWFKIRKNMYGILAWIGIIVLLAGDFHYWAGAIETVGAKENDDVDDEIIIEVTEGNYTITFEKLAPSSGSFAVGRPQTEDDSDMVPFEVKENACIGWVNLTGDGTGRPDLDLYILDPKGKVQASAASPEASEAAVIDEKSFKRGGPGTWIAKVDPYTGFNLQYSLDITIGYKIYENESCEGDACYD